MFTVSERLLELAREQQRLLRWPCAECRHGYGRHYAGRCSGRWEAAIPERCPCKRYVDPSERLL